MKLKEIDEGGPNKSTRRIRYRVTLGTKVDSNSVFWQALLNADSPSEAAMTAHQLFRRQRGDIQSTVMSKWEVREVTPIKKVEQI